MACVLNSSQILNLNFVGFVVGSIAFSALENTPNKTQIAGGSRNAEIGYLVVEWTCDQYFRRTRVFEPSDSEFGWTRSPQRPHAEAFALTF